MWSKQFIRNFSRFFRSHHYPLHDIIFISLLGSNSFLGPQRRISSWQLIVAQVRKSACTFSSTPSTLTSPPSSTFLAPLARSSPPKYRLRHRPLFLGILGRRIISRVCFRVHSLLPANAYAFPSNFLFSKEFLSVVKFILSREFEIYRIFFGAFFFVICFERVKLNYL